MAVRARIGVGGVVGAAMTGALIATGFVLALCGLLALDALRGAL